MKRARFCVVFRRGCDAPRVSPPFDYVEACRLQRQLAQERVTATVELVSASLLAHFKFRKSA